MIIEPLYMTGIVLLAGLAFANGSNDVSKGIATLAGSGVTTYRRAILWGTMWTVLGGILAVFMSSAMLTTFSGILATIEGTVQHSPTLAIAVMMGAMSWVLFASKTGLPVSTTHAIIGGLCGVGLVTAGSSGLEWGIIWYKVVMPLALSPLIAMGVGFFVFPATRRVFGDWKGHCICVIPVQRRHLVVELNGSVPMVSQATELTTVVNSSECDASTVLSLRLGPDSLHWITSGFTSLARSLNDTPKIAFLLLGFSFVGGTSMTHISPIAFGVTALSMGVGSMLGGRKVTEMLAKKVTRMNHHEGFSANLTTAILVTAAATFGLPVSTTHVSSSAIIGMGLRKGVSEVRWPTVWEMLSAWILTVPIAGLLSAGCWFILTKICPTPT